MYRRHAHTKMNQLAFWVLPLLLIGGCVLIWTKAANATARYIGVGALVALIGAAACLFLIRYRLFDTLVFNVSAVERHSLFGKITVHRYSDVYATVGVYSSSLESKPCAILTPKRLQTAVFLIDTGKYGNLISVNRHDVFYCPMDDELQKFLRTRLELEWVKEGESAYEKSV